MDEYENNNLSLNNVYNLIEIDKNSKVNHYIIQDNSNHDPNSRCFQFRIRQSK